MRLESAAQKCVEALLELIKLKVAHVVQEAVVVIKARPLLRASSGQRPRSCVSGLRLGCSEHTQHTPSVAVEGTGGTIVVRQSVQR